MADDPKKDDQTDVSRRSALGSLTIGAATSLLAARSALARSSDVMIDSAGRVLIQGTAHSTPRPEGSFDTASNNDKCANQYSCTGGSNKGCTNDKECVTPGRALGGARVNAPPAAMAPAGSKMGTQSSGGSGGSRK